MILSNPTVNYYCTSRIENLTKANQRSYEDSKIARRLENISGEHIFCAVGHCHSADRVMLTFEEYSITWNSVGI
jgi:hypothetical protein